MSKKWVALALAACVFFAAAGALGEAEFNLLRAVASCQDRELDVELRPRVFDDAIVVKIPTSWREEAFTEGQVESGILALFSATDADGKSCRIAVGRVSDAPRGYEELRALLAENCEAVVSTTTEGAIRYLAGSFGTQLLCCHFAQSGALYSLAVTFPDDDAARSVELHQQLSLAFQSFCDTLPGEQPATFASPALEAMLRKAMGKAPEDAIFPSELAAIQELYIANGILDFYEYQTALRVTGGETGPVSAADLRYFTGLQRLYLCDEELLDADALAQLISLRSLTLIGCSLDSCEPFAALQKLETLNLARNQLQSVEALASLTELKELNLFRNQVTDLSPLAGMTQLVSLWVAGNPLASLDAVRTMTALQTLSASDTLIASLEPLRGHPSLRTLLLDPDTTLSLAPLRDVPHLENLSGAPVTKDSFAPSSESRP
ncbi:MAG: leucine-rich repeat domain-containing protein [Eubacteriales bacterium]|nr:leucine-rich repeat domain-containing protein [Eubacteriales bacterium]